MLYFAIFRVAMFKMACNVKLVSSYGFRGLLVASSNPMLFCPKVKYKCCSELDELRFHKLWNDYYKNRLEKSITKFQAEYKKIDQALNVYKQLDILLMKKFIPPQKQAQAQVLWNTTRVFESEVFTKLDTKLKGLIAHEQKLKSSFICNLCDFRVHQQVSNLDKKVYLPESFCQNLMLVYQDFLKPKITLLEKTLYDINQLFNMMEIEDASFAMNPAYQEELSFSMDQAKKCLDSGYSFKNCEDLCSRYSLSNLSQSFFSNLDLHKITAKRILFMKRYLQVVVEFEKAQQKAKA